MFTNKFRNNITHRIHIPEKLFSNYFRSAFCTNGIAILLLRYPISQKSPVHKSLVRKFGFYPAPPDKTHNEEKLCKISRNPQNRHFSGEVEVVLWTNDFVDIWEFLNIARYLIWEFITAPKWCDTLPLVSRM